MNRLLIGLLLVLTAPLCAQAEQPNMAELKADAQKVASVIRGEEATPASVGPSKPDYPIVSKDVLLDGHKVMLDCATVAAASTSSKADSQCGAQTTNNKNSKIIPKISQP